MTSFVAVGLAVFMLALLITVGGGVVLYALVRAEHDQREVVSREEAARLARRDAADEEE